MLGALLNGVKVDIPTGLTDLEQEGWNSGLQMPDMASLRPMSWLSTEKWKVGSVICDFDNAAGARDKTSAREVTKIQLQTLESMGFKPMGSALAEFTLFYKSSIKPIPLHENVSRLLAQLTQAFEESRILVQNVFSDSEQPNELSVVGQHWLAGQLEHNAAICAVAKPTVNCYREFMGETLKGVKTKDHVNTSWTADHKESTPRIKLLWDGESLILQDCIASSACNPYLATAAMMAAGIDGLTKQMELPTMESQSVSVQPTLSLGDALSSLKRDSSMKSQLGALFVERYLYVKTDFEIKRVQKATLYEENNDGSNICPFQIDRELYLLNL
ncbi:glutamine synthetase [Elysia marginata]|uniref:Lengsin n=1 Tax=Elysia marginata TaxID=1093978 RepID=A0AAV4EV18_9GAST|nr:glutamine synthetase [Elysia marginata]